MLRYGTQEDSFMVCSHITVFMTFTLMCTI